MKWMAALLGMFFLMSSCSDDELNPAEKALQTKTIEWEVFHEFEPGETVVQFEISDDAQWLFYYTQMAEAYRVNMKTGTRERMTARPLELKNNKLYTYALKDYKSYFGVSTDFGASITEYYVGAYTNVAAGWYEGAFIAPMINRMFVMPNGNLIIPHIMRTANNSAFLADNKLIVVSEDGGATWERKETEYSFISAQQGDMLYAISEGWTGVKSSEILYSDNSGLSWQPSDLIYRPQALDRENCLIAGSGNEIQKFKNGAWTTYTWEANSDPLVNVIGLKYEGVRGDDPNGRRIDDFEFDSANNLYMIGKNGNTLCRTKLN
ncbi:exo-alpha-sialidase [Maribellus sp. CM-23]|uniref:sialidase family protein n=1 Tax=Maribellus sp. CM-23 TaxID=2781026 RepID=UPI001F3DFEBF|nr:sialidase family protein [Maribellus sp. CM-23]MCE4563968.1 exo-alpha-sialidase [Maribellus sp. CM-23]